jgi:hypothetical protein
MAVGLSVLAGCGSEEVAGPSTARTDCIAGGMDKFDQGGVDVFWKTEGRADFRTFIGATCRDAEAKGLLKGGDTGPALRAVAGQVILRMVDRGQIRDPR